MNAQTKQLIEQRRHAARQRIRDSEKAVQRLDEARVDAAKRIGHATATLSEVVTQLDKIAKTSI